MRVRTLLARLVKQRALVSWPLDPNSIKRSWIHVVKACQGKKYVGHMDLEVFSMESKSTTIWFVPLIKLKTVNQHFKSQTSHYSSLRAVQVSRGT